MSTDDIDVTPSPRLLEILGDIPLQPWQCLAELIDNSLDEISRDSQRFDGNPLRIEIDFVDSARGQKELVIRDNGIGMDLEGLTVALKAGATSKGRYGTLGLFGMGFNIATARLGRSTTVTTSQAGQEDELRTVLDFAELQRTEKFRVPLVRIPKADHTSSGTEVRVLLKRDLSTFFSREQNLIVVRSQLGDVYSYLLRDSVPGISKSGMSAPATAEIFLAGERVRPKLPCVWADSRSVQSYGQAVEAIQYIDHLLTDATACLVCGYWDRSNGPESCEECGSSRLELRSRRIWGWVGVQRYIDSSHYGIDFLRFGRKILKQDKSLFRYTDPDTLQEDVEYPIEMPANQGRLVGEIHLDHVPVTYQKNDFDRQSRDWDLAVELIRGRGPMKPRGARSENTSYLARLFSAYRRNDPGLRYLTPGDGKRALHSKAREWAAWFDKEVPRYVDDSVWFEAAQRHDEISNGIRTGLDTSSSNDAIPGPSVRPPTESKDGGRGFEELIGSSSTSTDEPRVPSPRELTRADVLSQARIGAVERVDLSGRFVLAHRLGEWDIRVLETNQKLTSPSGAEVPATIGEIGGSSIEILVNREDTVFREFGRDIRDLALIQAADAIGLLTRSDVGISVIYSDLVKSIDDLRVTPVALQEAAIRLLQRTRELIYTAVIDDPSRLWEQLLASEKQSIEMRAVTEFPDEALAELVDDGRFLLLLDAKSMSSLIRFDPALFFDNKVFRAAFEGRKDDSARAALVNRVLRNVEGLGEFVDDQFARTADDFALVRVQIESLARQLRPNDAL